MAKVPSTLGLVALLGDGVMGRLPRRKSANGLDQAGSHVRQPARQLVCTADRRTSARACWVITVQSMPNFRAEVAIAAWLSAARQRSTRRQADRRKQSLGRTSSAPYGAIIPFSSIERLAGPRMHAPSCPRSARTRISLGSLSLPQFDRAKNYSGLYIPNNNARLTSGK
jgi:hypothetical protein